MSRVRLTGTQRKEADRVPGIRLLVRWPAGLPAPRDLAPDESRPATAAEFDAARRLLDPQLASDGFGIRGVEATVVRRPSNLADGGLTMPHLAVEIAAFRWLGATDRPSPRTMWAAD